MTGPEGFVVTPMSRGEIRERASEVRALLGVDTPRFPILEVIEWALPKLYPDFVLEIAEAAEMDRRFGPGTHGMTYPDLAQMVIREDIYENACRRRPLLKNVVARFSLAHEFGHLMLHAGGGGMPRRVSLATPSYANSEWQANTFAGELMISWRDVRWDDTPMSLAARFGVSHSAARIQYNVFKKEGML